jgi:hypothetical protein
MRSVQILSFLVGGLLVVLGVSGVVFAQNDGCGLIITRPNSDPGNVTQSGCPDVPCLTTSGTADCLPTTRSDTYGNNWMVCLCPGWRGNYVGETWVSDDLCLEKFLPFDLDDEDGPGSVGCHPENCTQGCDSGWVPDPARPTTHQKWICNC